VGPARLSALSAACLLASGCGAERAAERPPGAADAEPAIVASVTDGDTLRLRDGRRVRLVQIDAPETGECYHRAATRALIGHAPRGARVLLARDPSLDDRDEHGRLLRYVLAGRSAANVNVALVRQGAAAPYFFRGRRGAFAGQIVAAAEQARAAKAGLWGACPRASLDPDRGALTGRA
jgi:micrococcal nuclease